MNSLGDQKNKNLAIDKLADNLLIKDGKGHLGHLKSAKDITKNNPLSKPNINQVSALSDGNLAVNDDNFQPIQHIQGTSQNSASFAFHPQDKAELEKIAKTIPHDDSKKYSIEKIVAKIIEKNNLKFNIDNKEHLQRVMYDFFRNRKKAVALRQFLATIILSSQKKLSLEEIDKVLSIVKAIKDKVDSSGGLVIKISDLSPVERSLAFNKAKTKKSAEYNLSKVAKSSEEQKEMGKTLEGLEKLKQKDTPKALIKEKSKIKDKKQILIPQKANTYSTKSKKNKTKIVSQEQPSKNQSIDKKKISTLPKVSRPQAPTKDRKQMGDIIPKVKASSSIEASIKHSALSGPIEELKALDLVAWRRLGDNIKKRAQKILNKIALLEQDSYTRKAQGISAWRESPLYKIYLQIGVESMSQNKEVSVFIEDAIKQGQDILKLEEFTAISDLNKRLRF